MFDFRGSNPHRSLAGSVVGVVRACQVSLGATNHMVLKTPFLKPRISQEHCHGFSKKMPTARNNDVTTILRAAQRGDKEAAAKLLPQVYDELRKLAQARMKQLPPGQTLQPT